MVSGSSLSKDPRDWTLTLGEHHLKKVDWFEQTRDVQAILLHPKYKEAQSVVSDGEINTSAPDYDIGKTLKQQTITILSCK